MTIAHNNARRGSIYGGDAGLNIMSNASAAYANTAAFMAYTHDGTRERIMASARRRARRDAARRRIARTLCTLLAVGLLIFGFSDLINAGVSVGQHGLALAALVMGGGSLVALIFALTEN